MRSNNMSKAKARIHIAKKDLAMSENEYREVLTAQTGKSSCGEMTLGELFKVEHYLKNTMGWKPKRNLKSSKRLSPKTRDKKEYEKTMVDKIRALWIDLHNAGVVRDGSENALEKWVERMSAPHNNGQGIQKLDWLGQNEYACFKVLESLKKWHAREV